jgi:hypothetical protein
MQGIACSAPIITVTDQKKTTMPQTPTLEERLSHVEQDLVKLKSQVDRLRPKENWIDQITGSFKDDPAALELPKSVNPWLDGAGMFRDDPLFDDWQRAIAEYRRGADRIADAP